MIKHTIIIFGLLLSAFKNAECYRQQSRLMLKCSKLSRNCVICTYNRCNEAIYLNFMMSDSSQGLFIVGIIQYLRVNSNFYECSFHPYTRFFHFSNRFPLSFAKNIYLSSEQYFPLDGSCSCHVRIP